MRPSFWNSRYRGLRTTVCCFAILAAISAGNCTAQTLLLFPYPRSGPAFEARLLHILPNRGGTPIFDGAIDVTANIPTDSRINLVASFPIINESQLNGNNVTIGNLFCGIQIAPDSTHQTVATIGMYFPTATQSSSSIPLSVNRYEIQRYVEHYATLYANVAKEFLRGKDYELHAELGTMVLISGSAGDTSSVALHYGVGANIGNGDVHVTFEYAGMVSVAKSFSGLGNNRFLHFMGLGLTYMGTHVQPTVMIELPLNAALRETGDGAIGVRFNVVM